MSIDTFRSASAGQDLATPGSFAVSTLLMEDAVQADVVRVGGGKLNQEALFSNPFKEDEEEAVIIDTSGYLTYLQSTDTSVTGWSQEKIAGSPTCSEVIVVEHPNGSVWAFGVPALDPGAGWVALRLELVEAKTAQSVQCRWVADPAAFGKAGPPTGTGGSLSVSYTPDAGPCVMAGQSSPGIALALNVVYATIPSQDSSSPWSWRKTLDRKYPGQVVGGGYLSGRSTPKVPWYVTYIVTEAGGKRSLRRVDWYTLGMDRDSLVTDDLKDFCGVWYAPNIPQSFAQSDVGCVYLDSKALQAYAVRVIGGDWQPFASPLFEHGFVTARVWQDADHKLHVFGLDSNQTLRVMHQQSWSTPPPPTGGGAYPVWASAQKEGGGTTTVIVGLHAKVDSFLIDPYPDYNPTQLIKVAGKLPAEAYYLCAQDVLAGSWWAIDKVRLPSDGDPHLVSHYVADVTLLDKYGTPMANHLVSVSADSLAEVQVDSLSYTVGAGRSVDVRTNPAGKVCISVSARGLTPPVVHVNADGLESGAAIDFAASVNDYLAGKGTLPSQKGKLTAETMRDAKTTDANGNTALLVKNWPQDMQPGTLVDHCAAMYGMAAGDTTLPKMMIDGYDEPQDIAGYVIQVWDPSRPSFQAFRTTEEVDAYHAYSTAHPSYGGAWDNVAGWFGDVWEGIKTGATKIGQVIVTNVVEISIKIGTALVSLGKMVIESIVQAAHAVEAAFQTVVDAVERVIDWLKALFNLGDIWHTKTALESGFRNQVPIMTSTLKHYSTVADGWFQQQENKINEVFDDLIARYEGVRMGDFANKVDPVPAASGGTIAHKDLDNPQASWLLNKTMSPNRGGTGQLTGAQGDPPPPVVLRLLEEYGNLLTYLGGSVGSVALKALFKSVAALEEFVTGFFATDTADQTSRSTFASFLNGIRGFIVHILQAADALFQQFMKFLIFGSERLIGLLDLELDLGFVNTLYVWVQKMANPGMPIQKLTVGGFAFLVAAFFSTTIHKLVHGVNTLPFPGGVFPAIPRPPWGPSYVPPNPGDTSAGDGPDYSNPAFNMRMVGIQEFGIALAAMQGVSVAVTDIMPLAQPGTLPKPFEVGVNAFDNICGGLQALLLGCPPVSGSTWNGVNGAAYGINTAMIVGDFFHTICGPITPRLFHRSAVLKNAGNDLLGETEDNITLGSILQMVSGVAVLILNCVEVGLRPPTTRASTDAAWVAATLGNSSKIFQIARLVAMKVPALVLYKPEIIVGTAALDTACSVTGNLAIGVPGAMAKRNGPRITNGSAPGEPPVALPDAKIHQLYPPFQVTAEGGNLALNGPLTHWEVHGGPAGLSMNDKGQLSGTPTEAGVRTFWVRVWDSYSPPLASDTQGNQNNFTIRVT